MIRAHERVAGGHIGKPRASGDDPAGINWVSAYVPVNPARAGMIPLADDDAVRKTGKPRASGDDPVVAPLLANMAQ